MMIRNGVLTLLLGHFTETLPVIIELTGCNKAHLDGRKPVHISKSERGRTAAVVVSFQSVRKMHGKLWYTIMYVTCN